MAASSLCARVGGVLGRGRAGAAAPRRCPRPAARVAVVRAAPVTDDTVPEGHRGLHDFLYGDEAGHLADVYRVRAGEDDGTALVPLAAWVAARDAERPLGVYAVYDAAGAPQYVGYSRNVVAACRGHQQKLGAERAASVRVAVFANAAVATRAHMEREVQRWLEDLCPVVPPGNGEDASAWTGDAEVKEDALSDAERAAYLDKKLKLRKAMGENLYDDVPGETLDAKARRLKMLRAVEGDDWSAVIEEQTQETLAGAEGGRAGGARAEAEDAAAGGAQEAVVSPFEKGGSAQGGGGGGGGGGAAQMELTLENVETALDKVRPYLIADGGNISVKSVEDGVISVELEGACGTCPSSQATMKMGVEANLRETFGDALKEVVQLNGVAAPTDAAAIDAHLEMLRPAIKNYGGSVEVLKFEDGVVDLEFSGPAPLAAGIQAALKDKFPEVADIIWHGLE